MRMYNSSCPGCSVWKSPAVTIVCSSKLRNFPSPIRMTSLNNPTQSWSRHPWKVRWPTISMSNERFVTLLDSGIVPRTMLISWRTAYGAAHGGQWCIEVHESSKWEWLSWVINLSNSLRVMKNTTPTCAHTYLSEMQFLQCVAGRIEDRLQTGNTFLLRRYRQNT